MFPAPKFIRIDSPVNQLAVYDTGENGKPVLFFIHGLSLNGTIWQQTINSLSGNYRCIAVDLPGHGLSWNQRGAFSMSFYAESIRRLMETMKLNDLTLIGHSMGGQISIILSLQAPALIKRLVLVCAAGIETFTKEGGQQIIQGAEFFYRAPAEYANLEALYQPQSSRYAERLKFALENHLKLQQENFSAFRELMINSIKGMISEPVNNFLPQLQQPVLVLYGENDKLIPNKWVNPQMSIQSVASEARQKIRNVLVKTMPEYGHYLPVENGIAVAKEIEVFCK